MHRSSTPGAQSTLRSALSLLSRTMASGAGKSNRLANEKSPYLLQHANNPVDWYPWGDEAFKKAKSENKPIFLSVGYSTCHWCHVMGHESFENEAIGALLNKDFVSIKVDREERPDVDKMYMTFIQAISGSGGWPMSVFLTPDRQPITGGTYFPPYDSHGRPGFPTILKMIAGKWAEDKDSIMKQGAALADAIKEATAVEATTDFPKVEQVVVRCYDHLEETFDKKFGGFGRAPKFPQPVNFEFLLHCYHANKNAAAGKRALEMVEQTLEAMARGGIHDHISQGFHRYSVDQRWHVPHFEKMLYDQAQLAAVCAQVYQITKNDRFKTLVEDILVYVDRDLSHPDGGFYSAEDADSLPTADALKKKEGAFCVWTKAEIDSLLSDPIDIKPDVTLAQLFSAHFSVKEEGNVDPFQDPHDELKSQNVLIATQSLEETGKKFDLTPAATKAAMEKAYGLLFAARAKRPRPHLDNKMVAAWNGLMITGFAKAAAALGNEEYAKRAQRAVDFAKKHLKTKDGLLRSVYTSEHAAGGIVQIANPIQGFADDYAFVIQGLLDLYETTYDVSLLEWAVELQESMDAKFWDKENNSGYYLSASGDPSILIRMKEDQDGAEPSTNSVAALNLVRLADAFDKSEYRDRARKIFAGFSQRLAKHSFILPKMITAYQRWTRPPTQVVIVGSRDDKGVQGLLKAVADTFVPWKSLIALDAEKDGWLIDRVSHYKSLSTAMDGKPTAFVCENFSCSLPVHDEEALKTRLNEIK
uniref:DUF255 domain-containing protein n=1 Tax=Plectus sambesii TaxID=2011161 RepID=A0A914W577_9BILA